MKRKDFVPQGVVTYGKAQNSAAIRKNIKSFLI
jgi:hypothetical protein